MNKEIDIRLRLITIQHEQVLLMYDSQEDYYFYVGGKLNHGETIEQGAQREIREECGEDTTFEMEKILYIRDFISTKDDNHSVELFIKGDINKYEELNGKKDPEFGDRKWLVWKHMKSLPDNLYPKNLTDKLQNDYERGFPSQGEYVGNI